MKGAHTQRRCPTTRRTPHKPHSSPPPPPHLGAVLELVSSLNGHGQFTAGTDDNEVRGTLAVLHDVGSLLNTLDAAAGQVGHTLAGQRNGGWALAVLHGNLVCAGSLVATTGPHHEHVGHGAEGGQVLDGLVGGAVLTQADGVVGHHVDHTNLLFV
jgi:hypothetical protein